MLGLYLSPTSLHFIIWKNPAILNISDSEDSTHVTEYLCGGVGEGPQKLAQQEASECSATKTSVRMTVKVCWQPALRDRPHCIPASAQPQRRAAMPQCHRPTSAVGKGGLRSETVVSSVAQVLLKMRFLLLVPSWRPLSHRLSSACKCEAGCHRIVLCSQDKQAHSVGRHAAFLFCK